MSSGDLSSQVGPQPQLPTAGQLTVLTLCAATVSLAVVFVFDANVLSDWGLLALLSAALTIWVVRRNDPRQRGPLLNLMSFVLVVAAIVMYFAGVSRWPLAAASWATVAVPTVLLDKSVTALAVRRWTPAAVAVAVTWIGIGASFGAFAATPSSQKLTVRASGEPPLAAGSVALRLDITVHGCGEAASARLSAPRAPGDLIVRGTPDSADHEGDMLLRHGHVNAFDLDLGDRGVGSCYLSWPALIDGRNSPVGVGQVTVSSGNAELAIVDGVAADQQGHPSRWTCRRDGPLDSADRPIGCAAQVALTEEWHDNYENVMLLVLGALFAVVIELVLRAYDAGIAAKRHSGGAER